MAGLRRTRHRARGHGALRGAVPGGRAATPARSAQLRPPAAGRWPRQAVRVPDIGRGGDGARPRCRHKRLASKGEHTDWGRANRRPRAGERCRRSGAQAGRDDRRSTCPTARISSRVRFRGTRAECRSRAGARSCRRVRRGRPHVRAAGDPRTAGGHGAAVVPAPSRHVAVDRQGSGRAHRHGRPGTRGTPGGFPPARRFRGG